MAWLKAWRKSARNERKNLQWGSGENLAVKSESAIKYRVKMALSAMRLWRNG
jgi:hypothetical protein